MTVDIGTAAGFQHRCELTDQEKQHLLKVKPQPPANVIGSWPVMMQMQPQYSATKSQRYVKFNAKCY